MRGNFDPTVTWNDIAWVRSHWKGPLILKGILDPVDAAQASRVGVDGIVVSNHGERQLDGVPSTTRALPDIVEAVGDRVTVLADGGVRSGLDVVRLLALGAKGVLIGRAWAYALAARGERGGDACAGTACGRDEGCHGAYGANRVDDIGADSIVQMQNSDRNYD